MTDLNLIINYWLPTILKLIKIGLYFYGQILFLYKAKKKEDSCRFELLVSFFFMCMNIGSILEVVTQNFYPEFYNGDVYLFWPALSAEALVYFSGFVGIGLLTLGTELNVNLKTHGLLSVIPFLLASATLYYGIVITEFVYYLALVIVIIPILYFYIAFKAPEGLRGKSFCVAIGYFLIFLGEAANYSIIKRVPPFSTSTAYLESLFGYSIAFFPPLTIIIGLILLFYGYRIK
ncbi:MAG: hypothetical protein ACTSPY_11165 [Candidatus Helarchaeota archaeon]